MNWRNWSSLLLESEATKPTKALTTLLLVMVSAVPVVFRSSNVVVEEIGPKGEGVSYF